MTDPPVEMVKNSEPSIPSPASGGISTNPVAGSTARRPARGQRIHVALMGIFILGAIGLGAVLIAFPATGGTPRPGGFILVATGALLLLHFRKDLFGTRTPASSESAPGGGSDLHTRPPSS